MLVSLPWRACWPCCGGRLLQGDLLAERRLHQPLDRVNLWNAEAGCWGVDPAAALPALATAGPTRPPLAEVLRHGIARVLDLAVLLVLGCMVAALVQTLVPREWLLAVGGAPTLSIVALMLLSLIVSVCSSVDAFLALSFAAQVTPGALWPSSCWAP